MRVVNRAVRLSPTRTRRKETLDVGYQNPVIPGFYPDPSVCRVGDEYVLVTSTFSYFPGVPIFRSRNLVDWAQIGNVLDRPSQLDLSATGWMSRGVCAPTIRWHEGKLHVITTVTGFQGDNNFVVTADDPAGSWSDPMRMGISGIDPDIAWDGARYRIDDSTGSVLEGPTMTWAGTGLQYPEAPHLYERDGTWYLMIAEGGTERGHAVSIARGPGPTGPWEPCPANPILSHRSTSSPIQNTGHADLVQAADGTWWMVLLGVRPRGVTPGFHVLGRETFLTAVDWLDGWPVVAPVEMRMAGHPPGPAEDTNDAEMSTRDDFDATVLDPQWVAIRRPPSTFASLTARAGWLTLAGSDETLDSTNSPAFVGRRQRDQGCRVRAAVDSPWSGEAGLTVMMDNMSHYEVAVTGDRIIARGRSGPFQQIVGEARRPDGVVVLQVETASVPGLGPDTVRLGYVDSSGNAHVLAELDGRYLSTEVACGFVGRVIGPYAVGCEAAFDWVDYEALNEP
jgi:xylan 1,4-beta-xylosidase